MHKVIHTYKLLSEKQAATLIGCKIANFNYYARNGRGPEPTWVGPDGRRYYDEEVVRGWKIPPRINARGE